MKRRGHIILAFSYDPNSPVSRVIRYMTRGTYSHVALVYGDEAIESSGGSRPRGVRLVPTAAVVRRPNCVLRRIPHPRPRAVFNAARTQLGKPYDYLYLLGWIFRRKWQDPRMWVCHELIVWAAAQAGRPIIDMERIKWLTVDHLYLISESVE